MLQRTCGTGVKSSLWNKYQGVFLIVSQCLKQTVCRKKAFGTATYMSIRVTSTPLREQAPFSTCQGGHKQFSSPAPIHTDSGSKGTLPLLIYPGSCLATIPRSGSSSNQRLSDCVQLRLLTALSVFRTIVIQRDIQWWAWSACRGCCVSSNELTLGSERRATTSTRFAVFIVSDASRENKTKTKKPPSRFPFSSSTANVLVS